MLALMQLGLAGLSIAYGINGEKLISAIFLCGAVLLWAIREKKGA